MLKAKKISYKHRKLIYGVGVNDAPFATSCKNNGKTEMMVSYSVWLDMIKRCYSKNSLSKNPTYKECSVVEEWHSFMGFKMWFDRQFYKQGYQLDKDIKVTGNKLYGPDTCLLVPKHINSMFRCKKSGGSLPVGISICKKSGKYKAQGQEYLTGKRKNLGRFSVLSDAVHAFKVFKSTQIRKAAMSVDPWLRHYLISRSLEWQGEAF